MSEELERESLSGQTITDLQGVFPKPLKPLNVEEVIDENGLSDTEKTALRNAWRFIAPFKNLIGKELFYDYLTEYETKIEVFRFGTKINLERLHLHATLAMRTLDIFIQRCLNSPLDFRATLEESMPVHLKANIKSEDILKLAMKIKEFIIQTKVLNKGSTETLENAFDKLLTIIGTYNKEEELRKTTANRKYTMMQIHYSASDIDEMASESKKGSKSSVLKINNKNIQNIE